MSPYSATRSLVRPALNATPGLAEATFRWADREPEFAEEAAYFFPLHYEERYAYPLIIWLHDEAREDRHIARIMPALSLRNFVAISPAPPQSGPTTTPKTPLVRRKLPVAPLVTSSGVHPLPGKDFSTPSAGGGARQNEGPVSAGKDRTWNCADGDWDRLLGPVLAAVRSARERFNVHPQRIFLVGDGADGSAALRLALLQPGLFRAAVSLGGGLPPQAGLLPNLRNARNVPLFFGVPGSAGSSEEAKLCDDLRLLHSAGFEVTVRQYFPASLEQSRVLEDVNRWLMELVTRG